MKKIGQQTANIRWNSNEYDGECLSMNMTYNKMMKTVFS